MPSAPATASAQAAAPLPAQSVAYIRRCRKLWSSSQASERRRSPSTAVCQLGRSRQRGRAAVAASRLNEDTFLSGCWPSCILCHQIESRLLIGHSISGSWRHFGRRRRRRRCSGCSRRGRSGIVLSHKRRGQPTCSPVDRSGRLRETCPLNPAPTVRRLQSIHSTACCRSAAQLCVQFVPRMPLLPAARSRRGRAAAAAERILRPRRRRRRTREEIQVAARY